MAQPEFSVLDRGFVRLIDHMGSDLSVVNAARVSFGKRKETFDEADGKLVEYLARHDHTSPFRHTALTFHVKAPIFVFRQWMKHRIASEFNEISGRYVEFPEDEFYVPGSFRRQAKVNKQGSEGEVDGPEGAQAMPSNDSHPVETTRTFPSRSISSTSPRSSTLGGWRNTATCFPSGETLRSLSQLPLCISTLPTGYCKRHWL